MSYRQKLTRLQQSRARVVVPSMRRPTPSFPIHKAASEPAKKPRAKTQHHVVGNVDFDWMGKRMQKIVRRMAVDGDTLAPIPLTGGRWGLWDAKNVNQRATYVRHKDAINIDEFHAVLPGNFNKMLEDVRRYFK